MKIAAALVVILNLFVYTGASLIRSSTVISKKPIIEEKPAMTLTFSQKKTSDIIMISTSTVEEQITEDLPSSTSTSTIHQDSEQNIPTIVTSSNSKTSVDPLADPTDYSTVWPTRWRPRRKLNFGAQEGDAGIPRATSNSALISFILILAFISGIIF